MDSFLQLKLLLAVLVFSLIIIAETYFKGPFNDLSIPLILDMQKDPSFFSHAIFTFATGCGSYFGYSLMLVIMTTTLQKVKHFLFAIPLLMANFLSFFLKNFYHDNRPSWDIEEIEMKDFEKEWGNPSAHAMQNQVLFTLATYLLVCDNKDCLTDIAPLKPVKKSSILKIMISFLILSVFLFTIFMSRLYKGAHTLNQVFFGLLIGEFCVLISIFFARELLIQFYKSLRKPVVSYKKSFIEKGLPLILLGLLLTLAHVILYLYLLPLDSTKLTIDIIEIMKKFKHNVESDYAINSCFIFSGTWGCFIGSIVGTIIDIYYFKNPIDAWEAPVPWWKRILRVPVLYVILHLHFVVLIVARKFIFNPFLLFSIVYGSFFILFVLLFGFTLKIVQVCHLHPTNFEEIRKQLQENETEFDPLKENKIE